uniref:BCAR3 adaptor protein, NSP family member n=1 Tax=Myripristis murdjan TaxID=586833 RepID=A0A668AAI7_9TELE
SLSSPGSYVLTCQWRNAAQHFKINKKVITLNEAYSRVEYRLEREGFDSVPALVRYYVGNRKSVSQVDLHVEAHGSWANSLGRYFQKELYSKTAISQRCRMDLKVLRSLHWLPVSYRLDRSSYHHAIAALENTSEEEEDGGREEEEDKGREKEGSSYQRPTVETVSAFQPAEFGSRLLPSENKPLEMVVLKRAKELLLSHNHHSIARHLLMADCQVARILGVSTELKGQMGVASGLELVTLPHGQQLRLDLMERHHTMAIGVAVDILGCTGSVEERASTLNRIILVALELKDTVALEAIGRLEQTWTTLRRNYTQTAITYEKTLKPFYKNLYEGTGGAELWETSDQGCDIMLRHLEAARGVAQNAHSYTANAQNAWQGDEDLLEVCKTDFQLRLLWEVAEPRSTQSDRYNKFTPHPHCVVTETGAPCPKHTP